MAAYADTRTCMLKSGCVPLLLPLLLEMHIDITVCASRALCKLCVDKEFFESCDVEQTVGVLLQALQLHPDR